MPRLSIIVTTYNVEALVEQCLASVVAQTLEDIEIIVVDDGSTDRTPEIIRSFAAADPRIRPVFLPENTIGGVASAANAGLDRAKGDYIGFVDGDDYVAPTMFEKLYRAAELDQSDLAICRYLEVVADTGETREPAERTRWAGFGQPRQLRLDSADKVIAVLDFIAVPWRKIYARRLIEAENIRFPVVDHFWEDNPFHWFTVSAARSISVVPEVLYYHRVGRPGQSMAARDAGLLEIFAHYEIMRGWLQDKGRLAPYRTALLSWAITQVEWVCPRLPSDAGQALFDRLAPIIRTVDKAILDEALKTRAPRTRRMMQSVFDDAPDAFLQLFSRQFEQDSGPMDRFRSKIEQANAFSQLARENIRTYGLRNTISKVLLRAGIDTRKANRLFGRRDRALTEEQMLKFLALLERDAARKNAEIMERLDRIERRLDANDSSDRHS